MNSCGSECGEVAGNEVSGSMKDKISNQLRDCQLLKKNSTPWR
jgi:hypothetical protein